MSLFSQLAGVAVNSLLKKGDNNSDNNTAMNLVGSLVQSAGGVSGVLAMLSKSGLDKQVNSWIGSGDNEAVDSNQLVSSLGGDMIGNLANKFGIDASQASQLLASALPEVINKITPEGKVDNEDNLQSGLSSLMGMLGK